MDITSKYADAFFSAFIVSIAIAALLLSGYSTFDTTYASSNYIDDAADHVNTNSLGYQSENYMTTIHIEEDAGVIFDDTQILLNENKVSYIEFQPLIIDINTIKKPESLINKEKDI